MVQSVPALPTLTQWQIEIIIHYSRTHKNVPSMVKHLNHWTINYFYVQTL